MSSMYSSLLDSIYRHYPRGLLSDDPAYATAIETKRLQKAQKQARADRSRLIALMEAIEVNMPGVKAMDYSYLTYDACYTVRVNADPVDKMTTSWYEVVTCISIIAPVYLQYQVLVEASASGDYKSGIDYVPASSVGPLWKVIANLTEQIFHYTPVERAIGLRVIPDIQVQNVPLGEATLYDCLFTPVRE